MLVQNNKHSKCFRVDGEAESGPAACLLKNVSLQDGKGCHCGVGGEDL